MRNEDFIKNFANGLQKNGSLHSLMVDGDTLYSYGYHYPLLININGKLIVNDAGYSATTARHISYARQHADYSMHLGSNKTASIKNILDCANAEFNRLKQEIEKHRNGTKIKEEKTERANMLNELIHYLQAIEKS